MDEQSYSLGRNDAYSSVLRECARQLDGEISEAANARWVIERAEIIAALRDICNEYGDNEWEDDLHLADVIEKHLRRHLDNALEARS